jgi:hypothetical protein
MPRLCVLSRRPCFGQRLFCAYVPSCLSFVARHKLGFVGFFGEGVCDVYRFITPPHVPHGLSAYGAFAVALFDGYRSKVSYGVVVVFLLFTSSFVGSTTCSLRARLARGSVVIPSFLTLASSLGVTFLWALTGFFFENESFLYIFFRKHWPHLLVGVDFGLRPVIWDEIWVVRVDALALRLVDPGDLFL